MTPGTPTVEMHPQRWGDPAAATELPESALGLVELAFGLQQPAVAVDARPRPSALDDDLLEGLRAIVGAEHVLLDDAIRTLRTRGKSTPDLLRARSGDLTDAPDAVVRPDGHGEVLAVLAWASEHRVAVVPFGGGTCVTGGLAARRDGFAGVMSLDLVRMKRQAESLRAQAQTDSLTGLYNRGHFTRVLGQELSRAKRNRQTVSLLLIDIDHFKAYNDHYGHLGGDGALRQVALALKAVAKRPGDLACRYGGEEFAIVLPATGTVGACNVAASTLARIDALALPHAASMVAPHVTLSIGVASLPEEELASHGLDTDFVDPGLEAIHQLIGKADAALYDAKRHGRNQAWGHGKDGRVWVAGNLPNND